MGDLSNLSTEFNVSSSLVRRSSMVMNIEREFEGRARVKAIQLSTLGKFILGDVSQKRKNSTSSSGNLTTATEWGLAR